MPDATPEDAPSRRGGLVAYRCPRCGFTLMAVRGVVSHRCPNAPRGSGGYVDLEEAA